MQVRLSFSLAESSYGLMRVTQMVCQRTEVLLSTLHIDGQVCRHHRTGRIKSRQLLQYLQYCANNRSCVQCAAGGLFRIYRNDESKAMCECLCLGTLLPLHPLYILFLIKMMCNSPACSRKKNITVVIQRSINGNSHHALNRFNFI